MNTDPMQILLVESKQAHQNRIREALEAGSPSTTVHVFAHFEDAQTYLSNTVPDVFILGLDDQHYQVIDHITQLKLPTFDIPFPVIVLADNDNPDMAITLLGHGVQTLLIKSETVFALLPYTVNNAVQVWKQ
ncbi:MAG: hypothetical protein AAF629_21175, partial [Chloroflexota bacterium]